MAYVIITGFIKLSAMRLARNLYRSFKGSHNCLFSLCTKLNNFRYVQCF